MSMSTELVSQMRAVSNRLSGEEGPLGDLGEMISDWSELVEEMTADKLDPSAVAVESALSAAKGFNPLDAKPPNGS